MTRFIHKILRRLARSRQQSRQTDIRRLTPESIYLGNHTALCRTIYGHKLLIDTRDRSLAPHLLLDGFWEKWITQVFITLVDSGYTVVDIGCNVGYYSLLAADRVGKHGKVICYEANREFADLTFQSLELNGFLDRSEVRNKAVFSENTTIAFSVFETHKGSSSIWASDDLAENFHDHIDKVEVDAVTLDSEFPEGTRIDLLKIDAEGAEPHIIEGAHRIITENDRITLLMEFNPKMIESSYGPAIKFYKQLKNMGFSIFRITQDAQLSEVTEYNLSNISHCDIVAQR